MLPTSIEIEESVVNKIIETIEINAVAYSLITNIKIDIEYCSDNNATFIGIWENQSDFQLSVLNCTIEYVKTVDANNTVFFYKLTDKNFSVNIFYNFDELLNYLNNGFNF